MSNRRLPTVLVGVLVLSALLIGPVAAKRPTSPPTAPEEERPLTAAEQAEADAKAAMAEDWVAQQLERDAGIVSLACVTPYGQPTSERAGAESTSEAVISGCQQPAYALSVEARDQTRGHYCGPAVGQVIANWSWAMGAGKNKYSQATIAGWMGTDINGGTDAFSLERGLERGTAGSPRRPGNWNWVVANLWDSDRDGLVADQLHSYVQSNVSGSRMPLAIPVKPHARNSLYYLSSWPRVVDSVGHWIAAYGWYAYWSNTDVPHIAYTDSSRDEGGSTGKFWDPTRHISAMIMEHTRRIVW
jgi:hypothetical protein